MKRARSAALPAAAAAQREAARLLTESGWPEPGRALADILRQRSLTWVTMANPLSPQKKRRFRAALALARKAARLAPGDAQPQLLQAAAWLMLAGTSKLDRPLQAARSLDPRSPELNCWLAYAYLKKDNPRAALERARAAVRARPSAWGFCLLGEACLRAGRVPEALRHLDECLRLDPDRPWAYVLRSEAWRDLRRFDRAAADLDALVRVHPAPWSYAIRARTAFNFRDQKRALADLDRAVALDPGFREGRAYRGEARRRLGLHALALRDFDACLRGFRGTKAGSSRVRSWRGAARLEVGRFRHAVQDLSRVICDQPERSVGWALAQRAQARLRLGDFKRAVADMNRALRVDPKSGWIYAGAGDTKGTLDRAAEIAALFTRALSRRGDWAWGYAWRGETLARAGRYSEALADLARAIALAPREARFRAWRGAARKGLGDWAGAREDFEFASRRDPRDAAAHGLLAELAMRRGDFRDARRRLDRYLAIEKRSAWAYAWRGECLLRDGRGRAARRDLETAVNLHAQYGDAWIWLAEARRQEGDLDGARAAVERALSLEARPELTAAVRDAIRADEGRAARGRLSGRRRS